MEIAKRIAPPSPQKAGKVAAVVDDSTPEELKIFDMEDAVKKQDRVMIAKKKPGS